MFSVPVVLIGFNRPDLFRALIDSVRPTSPSTVFAVFDGPRASRPTDAALVAETRSKLASIDWPCEVIRIESAVNLGCRKRIQTGLDEVFKQVDSAIVLEDDCLPETSFFSFCAELLDRYRNDERIAYIAGTNHGINHVGTTSSYSFSRYGGVWGWATWARTWKEYDANALSWDDRGVRKRVLTAFEHPDERRFWNDAFLKVRNGFDTWDFQLSLGVFARHQLVVVPSVNLISNNGFGSDATHTVDATELSQLPTFALTTPLVHPATVSRNIQFDEQLSQQYRRTLSTDWRFRIAELRKRIRNRTS